VHMHTFVLPHGVVSFDPSGPRASSLVFAEVGATSIQCLAARTGDASLIRVSWNNSLSECTQVTSSTSMEQCDPGAHAILRVGRSSQQLTPRMNCVCTKETHVDAKCPSSLLLRSKNQCWNGIFTRQQHAGSCK
jgi:hypothetical protein